MAFWDNLTKRFGGRAIETKEAPQVHFSIMNPSYERKDNYRDYAEEGYKQNAIVFRCVNEIATGASTIPFKVFQGDAELEAHPLISLLNRPNPLQAGVEYFQGLYSYLLLSGNSYAIKSEVAGLPRELHMLRPDRMEIVPSETSIPKGYNYKIKGTVVKRYEADPMTGQSEVKHFKMWHPMDDYYGLSPLSAAAVDVDHHNMIAKHNIALLNNGARPSGAIVFRPKDEAGNSLMLTDGQRKQIQSDLQSRFTGPQNTGRPVLLEGDFDWKEMGMSPKDMDFLQQRNVNARDIALCFGVPSQLVGIPDAQTYANVQEARLALYEETIIPLAKRVESDLNEWLAPAFGDNIYVQYDIDAIPAMAERRRRIYENVVSAVREGIISRNEARERLGYEPISGGDEVYIAANLFPLGGPDTAPDEGQDPEDAAKDAYGYKLDEYPDGEPVPEELPDAYQLGTEQRNCANCDFITEDGYCELWGATVRDEYVCARWEPEDDTKAESDVDTKPTAAMARNAERGLELRREYGRGGTQVGVTRARQLMNRENLSPRTVRRMHSYFSRHEVDKQGRGFRRGTEGWPSAGLIAWLLWGGDEGQSWARSKVNQLDKERDKSIEIEALACAVVEDVEEKAPISEAVKKGLAEKVKDHNDKYGDQKGKRVTQRMLEAVFRRGVGAFNTNPSSVRPSVNNADQWAYARVNAFLHAVRTGRFKGGKFDRDLLPQGHPLRSSDDD